MPSRRLDALAEGVAQMGALPIFVALMLAAVGHSLREFLIGARFTWLAVAVLGDVLSFGWVWCIGNVAYKRSAHPGEYLTPRIATVGLIVGLVSRAAIEAPIGDFPAGRPPWFLGLAVVGGYAAVIAFSTASLRRALNRDWGAVELFGVGFLFFIGPLGVWVIQRWTRGLLRQSEADPITLGAC